MNTGEIRKEDMYKRIIMWNTDIAQKMKEQKLYSNHVTDRSEYELRPAIVKNK